MPDFWYNSDNMYIYNVMDVSRALGLTAGALHFWEKNNLIEVDEVEKNEAGHRRYHVVDIFRFLSYKKYRSMGFPMKTVVEQFSGRENDRNLIIERLKKYQAEAAQKAKDYSRLAATINEHIFSAARIDDLLDAYEFVQSPAAHIFFDDECGWISKNRYAQTQVQKWIKAMPDVRLGVILTSLEPPKASLCYVAGTGKEKELNLPGTLNFREAPSQSCLHTIVTTGGQFTENPCIVFEKALKYADSRGFEIVGAPWGHILLVEVAPKAKLKPYLELWIPIS
jgi:DNA-binding transcriptional MerR regulator